MLAQGHVTHPLGASHDVALRAPRVALGRANVFDQRFECSSAFAAARDGHRDPFAASAVPLLQHGGTRAVPPRQAAR
eukprot:7419149-Pyramimonas_sp.AAC.1